MLMREFPVAPWDICLPFLIKVAVCCWASPNREGIELAFIAFEFPAAGVPVWERLNLIPIDP